MSEFFETLDSRFNRLHRATERLDKLYSGCRWAEGPAYFPAGRYLTWSDVPNNRILRFDECSGLVTTFRKPSANANGNTTDRSGRLISCEQGTRRITRTEFDGTVTAVADSFSNRRLNSPNDVVVSTDGSIWFTDPTYGIDSDYEGNKADSEQAGNFVYHVDPATGNLTVVADDFVQPNGLAFSPDENLLYVSDTGHTHLEDGPAHIRKFAVNSNGGLTSLGVFAKCSQGIFDGFRLDTEGHIWTSAADGVHCYHPDSTLLGKILVPEVTANVCFGGAKRNYIYICATTSLYGTRLDVNGAAIP